MVRRFLFACALLTVGCGGETAGATKGELVRVNGTELFVLRIGKGEPIVVVHGGPVLDHSYLAPHLSRLQHGHELIFYDQRACGRSSPAVDPKSIRMRTFVDDLETLRRTLGLGKVHLLAHSFGGLIAMHYAIEHPDNLRSLMLLDSVAASSELWQQENIAAAKHVTDANKRAREELRKSEGYKNHDPKAIAEMMRLSFVGQFHDPANASKLQLFVPKDYATRSKLFGNMGPDLQSFDLHAKLQGVHAPVLVLYGASEPGAGIGGKKLFPCFSRRRFVVIENAGHFPFIENPEDCLFQIDDFLGSLR